MIRFQLFLLTLVLIVHSQIVTELYNKETQLANVVNTQCNNHTFTLYYNGTVIVSFTRTSGNNPLSLYINTVGGNYIGNSVSNGMIGTTNFQFNIGVNTTSVVYSVGVCSSQTVDTFQYTITFQFYCQDASYPNGPFGAQCQSCPINSVRQNTFSTDSDQVSACSCIQGFKRDILNGNLSCTVCPIGAFCNGNDVNVLDGYYLYQSGGNTSVVYLKCPIPQACVHHSYNDTYTDCTPGYTGILCNNCDQGYYRLGERCYSCGNPAVSGLLLFVWVAVVLLFWITILPFAFINTFIGSLAISITFIQTTSLFSRYDLNYPDNLLAFFYALGASNFNIELARLDCFGPVSFHSKFLSMMFFPIVYFIITVIATIIIAIIVLAAKYDKKKLTDYFQWTVNGYLNFYYNIAYIFLLQWSLRYFNCDWFGTDELRQWQGSNYVCSASDTLYFVVAFFAITVIVVFGVIFPLSLFIISLIQFGVSKKYPSKVFLYYPQMLKTFGSLYGHFKDKFYFWEIFILLRKFLLAILFAYLPKFPSVGAVLSSFVILIALVIQLRFAPYRHNSSNVLETLLLLIQYFILIFSLMVYASDTSDSHLTYAQIITILIISFATLGILLGLITIIFEIIYHLSKVKTGEKGERVETEMPNDSIPDQSKEKLSVNQEAPEHGSEPQPIIHEEATDMNYIN